MAITEKSALARTLNAAREVYSAISGGTAENAVSALDSISAALSHCQNVDMPLAKCLKQLKKQLKQCDRVLYRVIKPHFSRLRPVLDYDFEKAAKHVPAIIYGNDKICDKLQRNEPDKARAMADAMKSYPNFLFGEFEALSDAQFYDLVFGFYPKLYEEQFMDEIKWLFTA